MKFHQESPVNERQERDQTESQKYEHGDGRCLEKAGVTISLVSFFLSFSRQGYDSRIQRHGTEATLLHAVIDHLVTVGQRKVRG